MQHRLHAVPRTPTWPEGRRGGPQERKQPQRTHLLLPSVGRGARRTCVREREKPSVRNRKLTGSPISLKKKIKAVVKNLPTGFRVPRNVCSLVSHGSAKVQENKTKHRHAHIHVDTRTCRHALKYMHTHRHKCMYTHRPSTCIHRRTHKRTGAVHTSTRVPRWQTRTAVSF